MLGRPPSKMPKVKLAARMKNSGFQAHLPILSPSAVSTVVALKVITRPMMASRMPRINGK